MIFIYSTGQGLSSLSDEGWPGPGPTPARTHSLQPPSPRSTTAGMADTKVRITETLAKTSKWAPWARAWLTERLGFSAIVKSLTPVTVIRPPGACHCECRLLAGVNHSANIALDSLSVFPFKHLTHLISCKATGTSFLLCYFRNTILPMHSLESCHIIMINTSKTSSLMDGVNAALFNQVSFMATSCRLMCQELRAGYVTLTLNKLQPALLTKLSTLAPVWAFPWPPKISTLAWTHIPRRFLLRLRPTCVHITRLCKYNRINIDWYYTWYLKVDWTNVFFPPKKASTGVKPKSGWVVFLFSFVLGLISGSLQCLEKTHYT